MHLELWVKVKQNWADSEKDLHSLGFDNARNEQLRAASNSSRRSCCTTGRSGTRACCSTSSAATTASCHCAGCARRALSKVSPQAIAAAVHADPGRAGSCEPTWARLRARNLTVSRLALTGDAMLSGYYVNELILHFLHRHDPQPELFAAYSAKQSSYLLARSEDPAPALRLFELEMLRLARLRRQFRP